LDARDYVDDRDVAREQDPSIPRARPERRGDALAADEDERPARSTRAALDHDVAVRVERGASRDRQDDRGRQRDVPAADEVVERQLSYATRR
jgi:hypothetical protein